MTFFGRLPPPKGSIVLYHNLADKKRFPFPSSFPKNDSFLPPRQAKKEGFSSFSLIPKGGSGTLHQAKRRAKSRPFPLIRPLENIEGEIL
jgi:hypothetical protein